MNNFKNNIALKDKGLSNVTGGRFFFDLDPNIASRYADYSWIYTLAVKGILTVDEAMEMYRKVINNRLRPEFITQGVSLCTMRQEKIKDANEENSQN